MLKFLALLLLAITCQVPSIRAEFFDYYLDYFNLRDKYIPFLNDDVDKINQYKELKQKSKEGLASHFEKQKKKREGRQEL